MEFPHGRHHHQHRNDDEEERRGYYPPPETNPPPPPLHHQPPPFQDQPPLNYRESEFAPPPPRPYFRGTDYAPPPPPIQETHVFHTSHHNQGPDPSYDYPPQTQVTHISHEHTETHHSFKPHVPAFVHHQTHESGSAPGLALHNKPTFKVYSKAEPNFHLTIRDGKVILAAANPSDEFQNWYKDEKYSTRVKDEEGCPAFALVNKATGQAMKHSIGATHPVHLIPYNPDVLDESVLWTESKDLGDGFRAVRMVNNIHLNVDAFHGDRKSGGVHDGTTIVLWKWNKGDNQRWKIVPSHCKLLNKLNGNNILRFH